MSFTDMFTQLVRAEIALWNSLERQLHKDATISLATFQALSTIGQADGPVRVQDISEALSITVGATSKLVDRLERDGLAQRTSNPNDRRSSLIALTAAGTSSLTGATASAEAHLASILGKEFSRERTASLADDLSSLHRHVAEGAGS